MKLPTLRWLCLGVLAAMCACARESGAPVESPGQTSEPRPPVGAKSPLSAGCSDEDLGRPARKVLRGWASYYHDSLAGNPTASGVPYDPASFSAAHRTLPFGTRLRVTRTDVQNLPVCVTVNDRGPFHGRRRIVDLSRRAAEALHMVAAGVVPVRVDVL